MKLNKNILLILCKATWILASCALVILFVAAIQKSNTAKCKGVSINIIGSGEQAFISNEDILASVEQIHKRNITGSLINSFNIKAIEKNIQKSIWVEKSEVYFDIKDSLHILVYERQPIARVYDLDGNSFYLDSSNFRLLATTPVATNIPVFTSYPLIASNTLEDKNLLKQITYLSNIVMKDSFLNSLCGQFVIENNNQFNIIPTIGKFEIILGDTTDLTNKITKLKNFYKQFVAVDFTNKYHTIDLRFKNQIVAKRRGESEIESDDNLVMQTLQEVANSAALLSADSIKIISNDTLDNDLVIPEAKDSEDTLAAMQAPILKSAIVYPVVDTIKKNKIIKNVNTNSNTVVKTKVTPKQTINKVVVKAKTNAIVKDKTIKENKQKTKTVIKPT